jgi:hypothetical protein
MVLVIQPRGRKITARPRHIWMLLQKKLLSAGMQHSATTTPTFL